MQCDLARIRGLLRDIGPLMEQPADGLHDGSNGSGLAAAGRGKRALPT